MYSIRIWVEEGGELAPVELEFPSERDAERFRAALQQIRDEGGDPNAWWRDIYHRYGGRIIQE